MNAIANPRAGKPYVKDIGLPRKSPIDPDTNMEGANQDGSRSGYRLQGYR